MSLPHGSMVALSPGIGRVKMGPARIRMREIFFPGDHDRAGAERAATGAEQRPGSERCRVHEPAVGKTSRLSRAGATAGRPCPPSVSGSSRLLPGGCR